MSDHSSSRPGPPSELPLSEQGFDVITFDCYGTLIDWESGIFNAFQTEADREGLGLDRGKIIEEYATQELAVESEGYRSYSEVLAETARRVASHFGINIPADRRAFLASSLPDWRPFPDTNAALERLAARFHLGILSNIDDELLALTMRHFTVQFDPIVTAQQVKSYKPGLAHFTEALSRTSGKRLLHAARSYLHDVVPASHIGLPAVWVNRNGEQPHEGGPYPTETVKDLAGLADLLT